MDTLKRLSDLTIREDRKATLQLLANRVKQRKEDFPAPPFFMLMGAGCSSDARIPTGSGLIDYLQKRCFAEWQLSVSDPKALRLDRINDLFNDEPIREKLNAFVEEKTATCHRQVDERKEELLESIPEELKAVLEKNNPDEDLWDVVKTEFYQASYYGFWFDITLPGPRERQQFIEEIIDNKEPSAAYLLLACVVNKDGIRTLFTTNFDDLINDAILQETNKKSRIYAHNELVKFINFRSPRPNIVKLHGDYLFQDMKNTLNETASLQDDQIMKLQEAAQDMGVIVTGYSGSDRSIMDALLEIKKKRGADFLLFWCARDEASVSWRAKYLINTYPSSYFVPVATFEDLVLKLYDELGCKLRPLQEKQDWVEKHHQKAVNLLNRPDLKQQSPTLEKALEVEEILAQAHNKSTTEEKIDFLTKVIERLPPNAALFLENAYFKSKLKRYEEALFDLDKAIKFDPAYAIAYNNRGSAKNSLKRYEEALLDIDHAIELEPKLAMAYNNRGNIKANLKLYEEALPDYDTAIELEPLLTIAHNNRGNVKASLKRYEEALVDLDKAIELEPAVATTYNNRAVAKVGLKRHEEALLDYDKAIELDPAYAVAYNNRGSAKCVLKRYEQALLDVDNAIKIDPSLAMAYATFAEIKASTGDIEEFYQAFETALAKGLENVDELVQDEVYQPFLKEERFIALLEKYNVRQSVPF